MRPKEDDPLSTTVIAEFGGNLYLAARQVAITDKHRSMGCMVATLSCSCGASVEWGVSGVLLYRYYFDDTITTGNQLMIACGPADEPLCEHWTPLPLTLTPRAVNGLADEKYVALDME